jgi:3D (Asp-Asp-Asp) domain-containing protein
VQTTQPAVITWLPADYQSQFLLTCYVLSLEADFLDSPLIDHVGGLPPDNQYHQRFINDVRRQGSGQALDGTIIHYNTSTRRYELRQCVVTATGICAVEGVTIAVDPHVIPLRRAVNVAILGDRIAQDTGGRIIGYHIDEYMGLHRAQCNAFGRNHMSNVTFLRY